MIENRMTAMVFDARNQAFLQQWNYFGGPNQQWSFERVQEGYKIVSRLNGKVLGMQVGAIVKGVAAGLEDYKGLRSQHFILNETPDGYCNIISANSNKVLAVPFGTKYNGTIIRQWDPTELPWTEFSLIDIRYL